MNCGKGILQGLKLQNHASKKLINSFGLLNKVRYYSNEVEVNTEHKKIVNGVEVENEEDEYYVDVTDIDSRWNTLKFESQQDIISYLNVKQEFDWNYLSLNEKKAIYYIAYGKWGARDTKVMNTSEFIFKLMTSMLLFSVLGFTFVNYSIDQQKIKELNQIEEAKTPVDKENK
ncbi:hypothetical protein C6P40_003234 [Pichia californica]|uniref:Transmembrane protein n=1 Tax=Pichia californica TaxID=460514 RepID=A0A9P6WNN1_9ASCO|nr:hypothetical protein C6P42_004294 [[Candida] californica]KAG0690310.1 hypothetical protein C6P40_003234 [[Candida] californica]